MKERPIIFNAEMVIAILDGRKTQTRRVIKKQGLACVTKDDGRTWKYGISDTDGLPGADNTGWPWQEWCVNPADAYHKLWDTIYGPDAWEKNPWVWVIEFKRIELCGS